MRNFVSMANKYPVSDIQVPRFEEANGFYTSKKRSKIMSGIKGKNTHPEVRLRKALWHAGLRYRKHSKRLPGTPDIASKKHKVAIFVDGEFWHGYQWSTKKASIKSNRAFWIPKIERNIQRDAENTFALERLGYTVFRFWTNEVKNELGQCVKQVLDHIHRRNSPIFGQ